MILSNLFFVSIFLCVFVAPSFSFLDNTFLKANCQFTSKVQKLCKNYKWEFPECTPWNKTLCTFTVTLNRKCDHFDCKVRKKVQEFFLLKQLLAYINIFIYFILKEFLKTEAGQRILADHSEEPIQNEANEVKKIQVS